MDTGTVAQSGMPVSPLAGEAGGRNRIVHRRHRGDFWKPCPGTGGAYLCCGYQILTPLTGCGMYCRYCILQVYLEQQEQVVFDNFDDLEREVREKMARWSGIVRFGTGEFADSLFLEPRTGVCRRIAALLQPYEKVLVEFKTKSAQVRELQQIECRRKVVVGFSMNTPTMIARHERGTASLEKRLEAAAWCEAAGFRLAFHFDPMLYYDGCEEEYQMLTWRILDAVTDPGNIAWWSMGGFRSVPRLKRYLRSTGDHLGLFSGELTMGEDHKYRYFRPLRVRLYRSVRAAARERGVDLPLYLCMESPEVWDACGLAGQVEEGLSAWLDRRAALMLGLVWHDGLKGGMSG